MKNFLQSCLSNGFIVRGNFFKRNKHTATTEVVPVSNYNYHDAFAPFF
jgi:hypothetical protein